MQSATKTPPSIEIQFLVKGTTPTGRPFQKHINVPFKPCAKVQDVALKRQGIEGGYKRKGYKVSAYTVSPHLKMPIA